MCYNSDMAKKTTLSDIAAMLKKQSEEIKDLTGSVAFVVEHMATKEQMVTLQTQVNSIETQLPCRSTGLRSASSEHASVGCGRATDDPDNYSRRAIISKCLREYPISGAHTPCFDLDGITKI